MHWSSISVLNFNSAQTLGSKATQMASTLSIQIRTFQGNKQCPTDIALEQLHIAYHTAHKHKQINNRLQQHMLTVNSQSEMGGSVIILLLENLPKGRLLIHAGRMKRVVFSSFFRITWAMEVIKTSFPGSKISSRAKATLR